MSSKKKIHMPSQKKVSKSVISSTKKKVVLKRRHNSSEEKSKTKKPKTYTHIRSSINLLPAHLKRKDYKYEENECSCETNCDVNCLNFQLNIECTKKSCRFAKNGTCSNTRLQKKRWKKMKPFDTKDEARGTGLKIKEDCSAGDFVTEYIGEIIDKSTFKKRLWGYYHEGKIKGNFYMMEVNSNCIIDATRKGNFSRFMNHSCNPSCEIQKWQVGNDDRVAIFAKRDLKSGDEITIDYQFEHFTMDKWVCKCGEKNCRGSMGSEHKRNAGVHDKNLEKRRRTVLQRRSSRITEFVRADKELQSVIASQNLTGAKARNVIRSENRKEWKERNCKAVSILHRIWNPENRTELIEWGQRRKLFVGLGERWSFENPTRYKRRNFDMKTGHLTENSRISVYWPSEDTWYEGRVTKVDTYVAFLFQFVSQLYHSHSY